MATKRADSMRIPDESEPQWDCLRCGRRMQKWKHAPGWVPPSNKGWFVYWFECQNQHCRTRQVMPPGAFVRAGSTPPAATQREPITSEPMLRAEDAERLAHFLSI